MSRLDDARYRKRLQHLHDWLLDGRELKRLQELVAYAKAHPRKRESTHYKVKNPDGKIYYRRKPKRSGPQRKSR